MKSMLIRRLTVAALTAAALLSVSACSVSASKSDVETKVTELLKAQNVPVESTTCPEDLKGEVGASIKCTVAVTGGQTVPVNVKVTSVENKTVNFEVTPDA